MFVTVKMGLLSGGEVLELQKRQEDEKIWSMPTIFAEPVTAIY